MGQGYFKKEKNGKWSVQFSYTNHAGIKKRKHKLGFNTKREAAAWMEEYIRKEQSDLDMRFDTFVDSYLATVSPDLRQTTLITKKNIIELHILPYFKDMKVRDIEALDIVKWQNEIKKKGFSDTYLRSVNAQLCAIFNHGVRFYHLSGNPCTKVGLMGKSRRNSKEIKIWTQEQMEKFLESFDEKYVAYYAFLLLYWTGIRLGEMLALTFEDVNLEERVISITKNLVRVKGEDKIHPPKTPKGVREITIPPFLAEDLREYFNKQYGILPNERIFRFTKSFMEHQIIRGAKESGVKRIRLHDIRHSHASMLVAMGFQPLEIKDRLGHEKIETTLNTYSHLYPNKQMELADRLEIMNQE